MTLCTSAKALRSKSDRTKAVLAASNPRVEPLETRTLLSAWSTINTYSYPGGSPDKTSTGAYIDTAAYSMAQDSAGNLYAAGQAYDTVGTVHGILLERSAGAPLTSWSTIEDIPNASFNKMAVDSAGDLFVTGESNPAANGAEFVAVRPAGQSTFTLVNDPVAPIGVGGPGIVLDGSGNAFFDTATNETVNGVNQQHWLVQKETVSQLLSFQSAFTTVDDFYSGSNDEPHNIAYVPSGASAGLYVVGQITEDTATLGYAWIVRKSADGGNTWSTVDDFIPGGSVTSSSNIASGVSGDLSGNDVYVVGISDQWVKVHNKSNLTSHWIVRKSTNGGATWTVSDDYTDNLANSGHNFDAYKVQCDLLGNMYVVGSAQSGTTQNAIVRANTGANGSWVTVDNYSGGSGTVGLYDNVFIDSSNNHYAMGRVSNNNTNMDTWLIRTDDSPTASPAALASVFSSTQITTSTQSMPGSDSTDLLNHRRHRC